MCIMYINNVHVTFFISHVTFHIWYVRFPVWAVTSPGACAYGASLPCRTACQHVLHACKRYHLPLT